MQSAFDASWEESWGVDGAQRGAGVFSYLLRVYLLFQTAQLRAWQLSHLSTWGFSRREEMTADGADFLVQLSSLSLPREGKGSGLEGWSNSRKKTCTETNDVEYKERRQSLYCCYSVKWEMIPSQIQNIQQKKKKPQAAATPKPALSPASGYINCLGCQRLKKGMRASEMVQLVRSLLCKRESNSVTRAHIKMEGGDRYRKFPLTSPCVTHTATHTDNSKI